MSPLKSSASLVANSFALLVILTAATCAVLFATLPGTTDVPYFWLHWTSLMQENGMHRGYALALTDYPPGSFLLLFIVGKISLTLGVSNYLLLKYVITAFAFLSAAIFWCWSRNLWLTIGFVFSILLNSACHGYLDAFYLPFLLLSLWALQKQRLTVCAALFAIAISIKWQPALIGPFVLIYACDLHRGSLLSYRQHLVLFGRLALGALPVVLLLFWLVSPADVFTAFGRATHHSAPSYQGLNINWIIQYVQYQTSGQVGSGLEFFQQKFPSVMIVWPRRIFFLMYATILLIQIRRGHRLNFSSLLWCALTGFLTYCMINTGVHENHLFVVMILAFLIASHCTTPDLGLVVFASLATNLNLFVFYGQDGRSPFITAPFTATVVNSVTLALSALNMIFLLLCWFKCCREDFHNSANLTAKSLKVA